MPSNAEPITAEVQSTAHFVGLDALRGMAALAILAHHFLEQTLYARYPEHAYLAVDFFFMLSGVVVAHAYERRLKTGLSFAGFVAIRVIRLYPLLLLGVVLGTITLTMRSLTAGDIGLKQVAGAALLAALILPVPRPNGTNAFPVDGPMWSLFFELVTNYIYAIVLFRLTTRVLVVLTTLLMIMWFYICLTLQTVNFGIAWDWTFPLGVLKALFPFLYGVLLFRLNLLSPVMRFPAFPAAAIMLMFCMAAPITVGAEGVRFDLLAEIVMFPAIIILGSARASRDRPRHLWTALGNLSYPLYVLHLPIIHGISQAFCPPNEQVFGSLLWFLPIATFCIGVAVLAFRWYDVPVRSFIRRYRSTGPRPSRSGPYKSQ